MKLKTEWRLAIDELDVDESVTVTSTMKESTLRAYIYGSLAKKIGKKFSIHKLQDNQYNITRTV